MVVVVNAVELGDHGVGDAEHVFVVINLGFFYTGDGDVCGGNRGQELLGRSVEVRRNPPP